MTNILSDVEKGVMFVGKEVGKVFTAIPRVIKLAEDVQEDAPIIMPKLQQVIEDAGAVAEATAKDSGIFITSLTKLVAAISLAIAEKAVNVSDDFAVITAFENFCSDFKAENVQELLIAWHKLISDTGNFSDALKLAIKQLEQDAKGGQNQSSQDIAIATLAPHPAYANQ